MAPIGACSKSRPRAPVISTTWCNISAVSLERGRHERCEKDRHAAHGRKDHKRHEIAPAIERIALTLLNQARGSPSFASGDQCDENGPWQERHADPDVDRIFVLGALHARCDFGDRHGTSLAARRAAEAEAKRE